MGKMLNSWLVPSDEERAQAACKKAQCGPESKPLGFVSMSDLYQLAKWLG